MKLKPKNVAEWYKNATQKERSKFLKKLVMFTMPFCKVKRVIDQENAWIIHTR